MDTTTVFGTVGPRSSRGEGIISIMKKIFLIFFIIFLLSPLFALAEAKTYSITVKPAGTSHTVTYEGFVPCGRCLVTAPPILGLSPCEGTANQYFIPCQPCHIFIMIDSIIDFILLTIVPPIATIIFIAGGVSFYLAGANPGQFQKAKSVLTAAIIGLVIIYTSWIIVNTTLTAVGVADWVGFGKGWFEIKCPVVLEVSP